MFVVTLPAARAHDPATFAREAAAAGADLLEIRGDLTDDLEAFESPIPLILAPRGGRLDRLRSARVAHVDLELGEDPVALAGLPRIRSLHDHERMPSRGEIASSLKEMRRDADLIKLAFRLNEAFELLTIARLREELAQEGPVVVTAMGPLAKTDRLLGTTTNAWTYAALTPESASAPGQLGLDEHRRFGARPPPLFGVIGGPGLRSSSPKIHEHLFRSRGIDAAYVQLPTADFERTLRALTELGFSGFSVTHPYKLEALALCDELDPLAAEVQSVNTLVRRNGRWWGHQTDAPGFARAAERCAASSSAVVVGSGGVVPAILHGLFQLGISKITVVARNEERRRQLEQRFTVETCDLDGLADLATDLLVWTLPVDRQDRLCSPATAAAAAIDLRYGEETEFMRQAKQMGYRVEDGLRLLIAQALRQFELFSGQTTSDADMKDLEALFGRERTDDGQ